MRFYNQQHKHYCGIDLHAQKTCPPLEDVRLYLKQQRESFGSPKYQNRCSLRQGFALPSRNQRVVCQEI